MHPVLLRIPFLHVTLWSFGAMLVLGFLLALFLTRRMARRAGLDPEATGNAALYCLIAGMVGARAFFVVHHLDQFRGGLLDILAVWRGGLEFVGGIIPAIAVLLLYLRRRRLPVRRYLDLIAVGLMLGLAFGRIGCLLNGCCFGKPTHLPWGIRFPYRSYAYLSQINPDPARGRAQPHLPLPRADYLSFLTEDGDWYPKTLAELTPPQRYEVTKGQYRCLPVHPTQLYACLNALVLCAILYAFWRRRLGPSREPKPPGVTFALALILYGVTRFLLELVRDDNPFELAFLTISQIAGMALLTMGVVLLVVLMSAKSKRMTVVALALALCAPAGWSRETPTPTVGGTFHVELPAHPFAERLCPASPFGVNTALRPGADDLEARLKLMQAAGIKWGRQDFTWRRIEREPGSYDWKPYDELVEACRAYGLLLFGNLAYNPPFHDPLTPEGVAAYCAFAAAAVKRYQGKIDHWQIWNEPNGGFWKGTPEQYARLLAAAGAAIHAASPEARVLGLNMAFCDVLWARTILQAVPYDCFDIACFHPYRPPSAPEERFDWWELDQYVKSWHRHDLNAEYPLVRMSFLEQTEELVKVMGQFGPGPEGRCAAGKPAWITEICWNTHIHPYGTSELRQADLLVRFHVLALASGRIEKVFWWTLRDTGERQFDQGDMVGLVRADLTPKYSYYAYGWMTRMLEGKRVRRHDCFGPDVYAVTFSPDAQRRCGAAALRAEGGADRSEEDTIVAWSTKPYAYLRVNNSQGLTFYDLFGTRRFVPHDPVRTKSLSVPLGESPIYIVGPAGLKAEPRPDPGW